MVAVVVFSLYLATEICSYGKGPANNTGQARRAGQDLAVGEAAMFAANPRNQRPGYLSPGGAKEFTGQAWEILSPLWGSRLLGVLNRGLRGDAQHRRSIPG